MIFRINVHIDTSPRITLCFRFRNSEGNYCHIRNYYLSNSKTIQDGNGNGNLEEIDTNDFLDGNWESMEMKGRLQGPRR